MGHERTCYLHCLRLSPILMTRIATPSCHCLPLGIFGLGLIFVFCAISSSVFGKNKNIGQKIGKVYTDTEEVLSFSYNRIAFYCLRRARWRVSHYREHKTFRDALAFGHAWRTNGPQAGATSSLAMTSPMCQKIVKARERSDAELVPLS